MFMENRFVYVDLNKTGTVAVLNALEHLGFVPLSNRHHEKPKAEDIAGRTVLATIRDPWSYYLSLWGYGVKHKTFSGPYRSLTSYAPFKARGVSVNRISGTVSILTYLYRSIFEDWSLNKQLLYGSMSPECFQSWLVKLLNRKTSTLLSGIYSNSSISKFSGLYTYRYCNLLCMDTKTLHSKKLRSYESLKAWEADACYVDRFIQTRTLANDLTNHLLELKLIDSAEDVAQAFKQAPKNRSISSEENLQKYYTQPLIEAVAERERLLIDKFDYKYG